MEARVLRFEPGRETWIANRGVALPETGSESALDLQMVKKKLDFRGFLREISADVENAHFNAGHSSPQTKCFDNHVRSALQELAPMDRVYG